MLRYIKDKTGRSADIYKIAICGLPASGKSTALHYFSEHTPYIINSDAITHAILESSEGRAFIKKLCGKELCRTALSHLVFSDEKKLKTLESFIQPKVIQIIKEKAAKALNNNASLFVVEIPLIFEIGFDAWFDHIIAVVATEEDSLQWWMDKGFTKNEYYRRINKFLPIDTYKDKLSLIIHNLNDKQSMKEIILQWVNNITNQR